MQPPQRFCAFAALSFAQNTAPAARAVSRALGEKRNRVYINNIQNLKDELINSGIASLEEIEGCSKEEIDTIEIKYGKLPRSYRSILELVGKSAGKLIDRNEFNFYYDQIIDLSDRVYGYREEAVSAGEAVVDLPEDILFISSRYMDNPVFIHTTSKDDSEVYIYFDEDERVELIHKSVWGWLTEFVEDAKKMYCK